MARPSNLIKYLKQSIDDYISPIETMVYKGMKDILFPSVYPKSPKYAYYKYIHNTEATIDLIGGEGSGADLLSFLNKYKYLKYKRSYSRIDLDAIVEERVTWAGGVINFEGHEKMWARFKKDLKKSHLRDYVEYLQFHAVKEAAKLARDLKAKFPRYPLRVTGWVKVGETEDTFKVIVLFVMYRT